MPLVAPSGPAVPGQGHGRRATPCRGVDTAGMPDEGPLKRLGGGRWETRDGRFAIEPQSGTWVVVDNSQTDDLGLPLVRGPFGSLTAAREAIEGVRTSGPAESPLADRLKEAKAAPGPKGSTADGAMAKRPAGKPAASGRATAKAPEPAPEPEPPPEPKWLRDLAPAKRREARDLLERLAKLDVPDPVSVAKSEVALDEPALARLAVERSVRKATARARSPEAAARAAVEALVSGRDADLDVRWRLVDERGRPIRGIDLAD
jgi:hypothetical protein